MTPDNAKPVPFTPRTPADALALEIAQSFHDEVRLPLYRQICSGHDYSIVYSAYRHVLRMPESKIKKSRRAYLIYLIKKYDAKT